MLTRLFRSKKSESVEVDQKLNKYLDRSFQTSSKRIQHHFSLSSITRKWNAANLGKPSKMTTVNRWLRKGPKKKNPRFETWVVGLASFLD